MGETGRDESLKARRGFASDNNAGVHPRVLEAVVAANAGHVVAYGGDPYTARALARFREHFGEEAEVFFVYGGTGANTLGLKAVTSPHHAVICTETAHVNVDECGAPEAHAGCKLLPLPIADGKLTPAHVEPYLAAIGNEHHVQPRVVSITQATELGTVYRAEEVRALADFAHRNGLLLHMDGARLSNAAAHTGAPLRELTAGAGVDVLSFGGAKNGMMYGEAVLFFDPQLARDFKYVRKQGMQLASKMRFIAAQFEALLADGLWLANAAHANRMAQLLAGELRRVPRLKITQEVEANAVFVEMPRECVAAVRKEYFFYVWNERTSEARLMTSFDTTEEDIQGLVELIGRVVG